MRTIFQVSKPNTHGVVNPLSHRVVNHEPYSQPYTHETASREPYGEPYTALSSDASAAVVGQQLTQRYALKAQPHTITG